MDHRTSLVDFVPGRTGKSACPPRGAADDWVRNGTGTDGRDTVSGRMKVRVLLLLIVPGLQFVVRVVPDTIVMLRYPSTTFTLCLAPCCAVDK